MSLLPHNYRLPNWLPIRDLRQISFVNGYLTILCHIGAFLNYVGGTSSQIVYKQRWCHCCRITIGYRSIRDLRRISFVNGNLTILCHIGAFFNSVGRMSSRIDYKQRRCQCCRVTIGYRSIRDLWRISFVNGNLTILCHIGAFFNSVGGMSSWMDLSFTTMSLLTCNYRLSITDLKQISFVNHLAG